MLGLLLTGVAFVLFVKQRYMYSLLIFFGLITNGFQIIPPFLIMMGLGGAKSTDLALLYVLAVVMYRFGTVWQIITREMTFRWLSIFLGFVLLDALYSLLILDYGLGGIVKVIRTYSFLLSFVVFFFVPLPILKRVMNTLAAITVFQAVVYLIQLPTGVTLLSSSLSGIGVIVGQVQNTGVSRYFNTPAYLTPVLFYYLFAYRFRSKTMQLSVLAVLLLTTLAPLSRAHLLMLFAVLSLYVLFTQTSVRRLIYGSAMLLVAYSAMLIDVVNYRINQAIIDLSKTFSGSLSRLDETENTFSFRLAHVMERLNYILTIPGGWFMGIGLLHEETPQAAKLPFQVALFSERLGRTVQIDTGDIVWSLLFLQLGFIGTILFVLPFLAFARFSLLRRKVTPYGSVAFLWIVMTLLGSMTGVDLLLTPFRVMILFLMVLVVKDANQSKPVPQTYPAQNRPDTEPAELELSIP